MSWRIERARSHSALIDGQTVLLFDESLWQKQTCEKQTCEHEQAASVLMLMIRHDRVWGDVDEYSLVRRTV